MSLKPITYLSIYNISYTHFKLPKKQGGYRNIYVPDFICKKSLKALNLELQNIHNKVKIVDCDHAFTKGRNAVTHAQSHLAYRYVLSLDIKNFFESIDSKHLMLYVPTEIIKVTLVANKLPQGFPTSPCLANIALIPFDAQLTLELSKVSQEITYTRYADDLTISFNAIKYKDLIIRTVIQVLRLNRFKINTRKTKLQDKNNGRVIITGLSVSYTDIRQTRKNIKKIRAAIHQNNKASLKGLYEWGLCRLPKQLVE